MFLLLDRLPIDFWVTSGTALLGCVAGVIGCFAVLRRRALIGDVLAHAALPGLCVAFAVMGTLHLVGMMIGAMLAGLIGIGFITLVCRLTRTKEDAAMGIVLATFFGLGVMLSGIIQRSDYGGEQAGLERFILGSAAGISRGEVFLIALVAIFVLVVLWACYKEFQLFSFDSAFASSLGWPAGAIDLAMMAMLALVAMIGLPAIGVVMTAALLIIPGATARFWVRRLGPMLLLSGILGSSAALLGTLLTTGLLTPVLGFDPLAFGHNTHKGLPPGPVIVLCGATMFLFSMLLAPHRGVFSRAMSHVRLRRKTARENLLRSLYELSEPMLPKRPAIGRAELLSRHAWSRLSGRWLFARAARRGLVELTPRSVRLTPRGLTRAMDVTRTHRLWELFLIEGVAIAADHVDRDADAIEHLLPRELVRELESQFAHVMKPQQVQDEMPVSPHELGVGHD